MPLFVSMHFRYKLDINANFTMQNGEWVFISAFFLLLPHLTPKDLSLFFTRCVIMLHIFSTINKNKTAFRPGLVPRGTLSSILIVKLADDMPAYQFESTKDLLKTATSATWKYNKEHSSHAQ